MCIVLALHLTSSVSGKECTQDNDCEYGHFCDVVSCKPGASFTGRLYAIAEISDPTAFIETGTYGSRTRPYKQIVLEVASSGVKILDASSRVLIHNHQMQSITHVILCKTCNLLVYVYGNPTTGYAAYYFENLDSKAQKVLSTMKDLWTTTFTEVDSCLWCTSSNNVYQLN